MKRTFDPSKPEMVDLPDPDPLLLRGELVNLRKINRRFGGISSVRREIEALARLSDPDRPLELLDLATGSADVPVALIGHLAGTGRTVRVTAVDRNPLVLEEAFWHAAGTPEITFVQGDILGLDYPDGEFDVVLCTLALHHFEADDAVRIIREMDRLSRVGFVLSDLRRSYAALCGAWLYTRLTTTNVMTRTDALASVRASFTEEEMRDLLARAGVEDAAVRRDAGFRMVVTRAKT